jgi:hypothetical protein
VVADTPTIVQDQNLDIQEDTNQGKASKIDNRTTLHILRQILPKINSVIPNLRISTRIWNLEIRKPTKIEISGLRKI